MHAWYYTTGPPVSSQLIDFKLHLVLPAIGDSEGKGQKGGESHKPLYKMCFDEVVRSKYEYLT